MTTAWQQERRRASASQFGSEAARGLARVLGALDEEEERKREEQERADRKAEREAKSSAEAEDRARRIRREDRAAELAEKREARLEGMALRARRPDAAPSAPSALRARSAVAPDAKERPRPDVGAPTPEGVEYVRTALRAGLPLERVARLAREDAPERAGSLDDDIVAQIAEEERDRAMVDAAAKAKPAAAAPRPKPPGGPRMKTPASPGKPLEATIVKDVGDADATMAAITQMQAEKPTIDTGMLAALRNTFAQAFGFDDPKASKFRADVANLTNEIISRLSGANVPPAEMERIAQGLPQFSDNDAAFSQKLQATRERVERARNAALRAAKAGGRDVSGFRLTDGEPDPEMEALSDEELRRLERGGR